MRTECKNIWKHKRNLVNSNKARGGWDAGPALRTAVKRHLVEGEGKLSTDRSAVTRARTLSPKEHVPELVQLPVQVMWMFATVTK